MGRDDVAGLAAEMAFHVLFALFPFLIFSAAIFGFIGDLVGHDNLFSALMRLLAFLLPQEIQQVMDDWVAGVVNTRSVGLLTLGAAAALWSATGGVGTLIKGLNRSYRVAEDRPFWQARVMAVLTTVGLTAFMVAGVTAYAYGERLGRWVTDQLQLGEGFLTAWRFVQGPGVTAGLALYLVVLYAMLPNAGVGFRGALPGASFATVAWIMLTMAFSLYLSNFATYDATFGSLGAAVMLMAWMYAVSLILLVGGEINATLRDRRRRAGLYLRVIRP
jgi:membrane protein